MSVAIRGLSAAAAAALTFGIVTQPSGSAAQTSGHERADGNHSHQRVAVLVRPAKHFNELMREAHQRIKHQQAVRDAKAAKAAKDSGSASGASLRRSDSVTRAPRRASSSAAASPLLAAPATVTRVPVTSNAKCLTEASASRG